MNLKRDVGDLETAKKPVANGYTFATGRDDNRFATFSSCL